MLPAARKNDPFACPAHGGGVIVGPCCADVLIGNHPAARVGDGGACGSSGVTEAISRGNPLVLIGGAPAAGLTHVMTGGGMVAGGCGNVFLGNPAFDANGNVVATPPECKFVLNLLSPPPDNLGRFRAVPQITPGPPVSYAFPGVDPAQTATTTFVSIRGHMVAVVSPAPGTTVNGALPSVAQVASSLAALSDEQLGKVQTVVLNPVSSPNDPYWQEKRNNPNHHSAAEAGDGRITIFPGAPWPSSVLDRVVQHETGHLIWERLAEEEQDAWQEAMAAERRAVSAYGNNDMREDFCEALLMYSLVKGTPCEAIMKAAFPGRFALLEKVLGKKGFRTP